MIYADYNGSAPLLTPVREHLKKRMDTDLFANPNAIHSISQKLARGIEKCREIIAETVGRDLPHGVVPAMSHTVSTLTSATPRNASSRI